MENKETVMCERCGGDFAAWWIEDCNQMWCRDCRDALTQGLIHDETIETQLEKNNKLDPEFTKELIMSEINERGSICIEADSLENTFDEDKFYDWLDEMELAMSHSYTIYSKDGIK